jgi:hypothetical protein
VSKLLVPTFQGERAMRSYQGTYQNLQSAPTSGAVTVLQSSMGQFGPALRSPQVSLAQSQMASGYVSSMAPIPSLVLSSTGRPEMAQSPGVVTAPGAQYFAPNAATTTLPARPLQSMPAATRPPMKTSASVSVSGNSVIAPMVIPQAQTTAHVPVPAPLVPKAVPMPAGTPPYQVESIVSVPVPEPPLPIPVPMPFGTVPPTMMTLNSISPGYGLQAPVSFPPFGYGLRDMQSASIQPIIHPGHEPRQDDVLAAVIVTICSSNSYDPLFSQVPQLAGEGQRVATYQISASALPHIYCELSGTPVQEGRSGELHRNLRHLMVDIDAVQSDSVVFNWECCAGCSDRGFEDSPMVLGLVKKVLDRGHMVMFSDFSLKALIRDWKEGLLGPHPFLKVTEFHSSFKLGFDPASLSACPSAQLQKLGELASDGKASLHALGGTIAFTVNWLKADCTAYDCKVLTVMTELDGRQAQPPPGQECEAGGCRGLAGHILLTYPSGGKLLASAGHWVELSRLDVTEANFYQAAASYGAAFQAEIQQSMASCQNTEQVRQTVQAYSSQMIQQTAPCSYSMAPMAPIHNTAPP